MKLSVIIPTFKEPLSVPTTRSLLENSKLGDQLEVINVLDGYWPDFKLVDDPRVIYLHLGKNRGMRGAINAGVKASRGEFIMRTDSHCMFAPGYDKELTDTCKDNWIITGVRYFLDPVKWERMDIPPVIYEKLVIQGGKKFSGARWPERDKERDKPEFEVDETMAMQGSVWLMSRSWWDKVIKELQSEGYGPAYQDSHEMIFKTWQAGGKMMIDKRTWYAHKHRSFARTHNEGTKENPWIREDSWAYALKVWRDYYEKEVRPKWKI